MGSKAAPRVLRLPVTGPLPQLFPRLEGKDFQGKATKRSQLNPDVWGGEESGVGGCPPVLLAEAGVPWPRLWGAMPQHCPGQIHDPALCSSSVMESHGSLSGLGEGSG